MKMKIKILLLILILLIIMVYKSRKTSFGEIKRDILYCQDKNDNQINDSFYLEAYKKGTCFINSRKYKCGDAVMFDIDDTLLKVCKNENNPCKNGALVPIKNIMALLNYCKTKGYRIIIITARPDNNLCSGNREGTINDLRKNGICYDELHLDDKKTNKNFKSDLKVSCKYNIVMSVGDQEEDIDGPKSGFRILLPSFNNNYQLITD